MPRGVFPRKTTSERFWSKVDKTSDPNGCWLWTAYIDVGGYGKFDGRALAHRYAYTDLRGEIPHGLQLDHTCHNRSCVNPSHLRTATNKQNAENRKALYAHNRSGYRGVSWSSRANKWFACVRHSGATYYVGYFLDAHEAGEAVRLKRLELFTHNDSDRLTKGK